MAAAKKEELVLSPAEAQMLQMMRNGSGKRKEGLGLVWSSTTDAIGETFQGISSIARAGRVLAEQAEEHALIGKAESGKELLSAYGIEATGYDAVVQAKQLKKMLLSS